MNFEEWIAGVKAKRAAEEAEYKKQVADFILYLQNATREMIPEPIYELLDYKSAESRLDPGKKSGEYLIPLNIYGNKSINLVLRVVAGGEVSSPVYRINGNASDFNQEQIEAKILEVWEKVEERTVKMITCGNCGTPVRVLRSQPGTPALYQYHAGDYSAVCRFCGRCGASNDLMRCIAEVENIWEFK